MLIRFSILICFVSLLFINCSKDKDVNNLNNTQDTLIQYIKYTLNDTIYSYFENDTNVFLFYPTKGIGKTSLDTNNFLYIAYLRFVVVHEIYNGAFYDDNTFEFFVKLSNNKMDWENNDGPVLKQGVLESLFSVGNMNYLDQYCFDSITNITTIGINFPFYKKTNKAFCSYRPGCLDPYEENAYKQDSGYFRINMIMDYDHKKYRDCLLLIGEFRANLYYAPTASWADTLFLKNGKFKILVTDSYWH